MRGSPGGTTDHSPPRKRWDPPGPNSKALWGRHIGLNNVNTSPLLHISLSCPCRGRIPPMGPAWVRLKMPGRCLAFTLLGACATLPAAQQPPKPPASLAPRLIVLPPKVLAGAPATLAVLDSQGRLLPDIAVELSGGQKVKTDVTGRAMFKAPDRPGVLLAKATGQEITASSIVMAAEDSSQH